MAVVVAVAVKSNHSHLDSSTLINPQIHHQLVHGIYPRNTHSSTADRNGGRRENPLCALASQRYLEARETDLPRGTGANHVRYYQDNGERWEGGLCFIMSNLDII